MKKKAPTTVELKRSVYRKLEKYAKESWQTIPEVLERIIIMAIEEDEEMDQMYENGEFDQDYLEMLESSGVGPRLVKLPPEPVSIKSDQDTSNKPSA